MEAGATYLTTHGYDPLRNLLTSTEVTDALGGVLERYEYDYDLSGRLVWTRDVVADVETVLEFDALGQLRAYGATQYDYDPFGKRINKTDGSSTRLYHYDASGKQKKSSLLVDFLRDVLDNMSPTQQKTDRNLGNWIQEHPDKLEAFNRR